MVAVPCERGWEVGKRCLMMWKERWPTPERIFQVMLWTVAFENNMMALEAYSLKRLYELTVQKMGRTLRVRENHSLHLSRWQFIWREVFF